MKLANLVVTFKIYKSKKQTKLGKLVHVCLYSQGNIIYQIRNQPTKTD